MYVLKIQLRKTSFGLLKCLEYLGIRPDNILRVISSLVTENLTFIVATNIEGAFQPQSNIYTECGREMSPLFRSTASR